MTGCSRRSGTICSDPRTEDEVLRQSPKTRYLVGMLAPSNTEIDAAEDEQDVAHGEGDEAGGGQVPLRLSLEASSIGLSWSLPATSTRSLRTPPGASTARRPVVEDEIDPEDALDLDRNADPEEVERKKPKQVTEWTRHPQTRTVEIPLSDYRAEDLQRRRASRSGVSFGRSTATRSSLSSLRT